MAELKESRALQDIIVVDNSSTDGSWDRLKELEDRLSMPHIHVLRTERNGGYGMGNQAGINYAIEYTNPDYIVIANPDIHVTDRCILRVKQALSLQENGGAASALVVSPEGKRLFSYWDLLPLWKDLLDTEPVARRIFRPWLITPPGRLPKGTDRHSRLVGALPGSFFMLKMGSFTPQEAGELFDEGIFLYYEEKVLGQKLASRGLTEVLVTDASYVHAHSVSIDKSVSAMAGKQRLLHESKLYYYENYLGTGPWGMFFAGVYLRLVLWEVWLLTGGWKRKRHG